MFKRSWWPLALVVTSAWGQVEFLPESRLLVPHRPAPRSLRMHQKEDIPSVTPLAQRLTARMTEVLAQAPVACEDARFTDFIYSLALQDHTAECREAVKSCLTQEGLPAMAIIQAANCAKADNLFPEARAIFEAGLSETKPTGDELSALTLAYAIFAEYSIYATETDAILARQSDWDLEKRQKLKALVQFSGRRDPEGFTKVQIFQFLESLIAQAQGTWRENLLALKVRLHSDEYDYGTAYGLLLRSLNQISNPVTFWELGYDLAYVLRRDGSFTDARALYDAFAQAEHPRSYLPVERNVLTYTEIAAGPCRSSMMSGEQLDQFNARFQSWKKGELALADFASYLEREANERPRSDLLSAQAGIYSLQGQRDRARATYWKAHQLCRYNNRAHWGLGLLTRQERYEAYPEFAASETQVRDFAARAVVPAAITSYYLNWRSLPDHSREHVTFGARIWLPYIQAMQSSGYNTYVKIPFERLSESPNLERIRDMRIEYPHDGRLWDDVRGLGGNPVVADHDEVLQTVHGAYNLMGHEMAHQFHYFLKDQYGTLAECIDRLYAAAKQRDVFPDGYAKTNEFEYFAQGVTYALIPETAPARFGLNRSWLPAKDPDLYRFIQSIESAQGDVSKINCSI